MAGGTTCAILDSGSVRCWGYGPDGQRGSGSSESVCEDPADLDDTPANAPDVALGAAALHIASGGHHTCAVTIDGKVYCWGSSEAGELGYNMGAELIIGDDETPLEAGPVEIGGKALRVAAGDEHTCVVLEGGAVRCWGNGFGTAALDGSYIGDDETPASRPPLELSGPAVDVVAGRIHTCALLKDGRVQCWGYGKAGQLGYADEQTVGGIGLDVTRTPVMKGTVDVGGKVIQLDARYDRTCALLENKTVRCWGDGRYLGYGNKEYIGDDETPASLPGPIDVGGPVKFIAMGEQHTCALLESGGLRCWGDGSLRALGYGGLGTYHENVGDDETPASMGDVPWMDAKP